MRHAIRCLEEEMHALRDARIALAGDRSVDARTRVQMAVEIGREIGEVRQGLKWLRVLQRAGDELEREPPCVPTREAWADAVGGRPYD